MSNEPPGCLGIFLTLLKSADEKPAQKPSPDLEAADDPPTPPKAPPTPPANQYIACETLFSKGEQAFLKTLYQAVASEYLVYGKIRLADVIKVPPDSESRRSLFNKIQSKHVDYLLCSRKTTRPILVIELDDKTHNRKSRKERDAFVDEALGSAGIPILHVTAASTYDAHHLRKQITSLVS